MTKIKLCGLKRDCDIDYANECMPDYIGFVFYEKSRRYIQPVDALRLKEKLSKDIKSVGVFVDEKIENILDIDKKGIIDIIQLHGSESEEYIKKLREHTDKPIIKAISINDSSDIKKANECTADFLLLDNGKGGTGEAFDWRIVKDVKKPYFLAGGLGIDNINEALRVLSPYAVDTSSGIETDGYKDKEKMCNFVLAVRGKDM